MKNYFNLGKRIYWMILLSFICYSGYSQNNPQVGVLQAEIGKKNAAKVIEMIDKDLTLLEMPNPRGSTPLIVAASFGMQDLVKYLIEKGADVNAINAFGNTPLHYAAWKADEASFKLLHKKGAKLNVQNGEGQTPLQYSCMGGSYAIFKYCIDNGMDINEKCNDGSSLIHWAALGGNVEIFSYLGKNGFDILAKDKDGSIPMYWAASGNKLDMVKFYVEKKGIDLNKKDNAGTYPLQSAINRGSIDVAKYMIEKGARLDVELKDNESKLTLAEHNNNVEMGSLLIEKGCAINTFDDFGSTPLITAVAFGNFDVVKLLIEKGAKLNPGLCERKTCTNTGQSPLRAASWRFSYNMEYLIEKGADVNAKDLNGDAPMHNAARSDSTRGIQVLCKNKADVNVQNTYGITPLMAAVMRNKKENSNILLDNKANVNLADNFGKTALHYAAVAGYGEMCDLLFAKVANLNAKDKNGNTPLYYATYFGNNNIAKNIVIAGAMDDNFKKIEKNNLQKHLQEGEAMVWYLNHSGWALKTKSHFLIFDYWQLGSRPDNANINNGWIDAKEIKDMKVLVFASHSHQDHYSNEIFTWKNNIPDIKYVLGFETSQHQDYMYIPPRQEKNADGVKITTIASNDSGEGFMLEVDGLIIYYPGDLARRYRESDKAFSDEIDFLTTRYKKIDIAFVPVTGCGFRDKVYLNMGNDDMVKKFNPDLVLPMHGSGTEIKYKEYAEERNEANNTNVYKYVLDIDERMFYKKDSAKLGVK